MKRIDGKLSSLISIPLLVACAGQAMAQVNVDPTKASGDFIAGSGIPGDNFFADVNDVGVYVKARGRDSGQALAIHGNTYIVLDGPALSNPGASWWATDFQFTPRAIDIAYGSNYFLTYALDIDPTVDTNFKIVTAPLFDADASPSNSWDDTDGYFTNPGPGLWSDDAIDFVYSQSWRTNFSFLAGSILPAGDYEVRFTAMPTAGPITGQSVAASAHVRVIPAGSAALTLDAQDACLDGSETQVVMEVNLANAGATIVGGQFFLGYDNTKLDFVSADAGDAPFDTEIYEFVNEATGEIDYGVGVTPGGSGTAAATTMVRLTFDVLGDFCHEDDLVYFRTGVLPTRITDDIGSNIQPTLVDAHVITRDSVAPTITAPVDISVYADAGYCSAVLDTNEEFDNTLCLSATQAPGCWYTDRYAPAAFESASFDGDNRLHIGIDDADFQSTAGGPNFYNTQGRKYDVDIPVGFKWSGKLYIPSDWETSVRRSDIWATTFAATQDIYGSYVSGYPILGFTSNDPNDSINPSPASPTPRFRWYTQDTDQDPSNGYTADWVDLGLPVGFSYDRWWTLEVEMTDGAFIARVIDDGGNTVLTYTDILTFGSIRAGNIIMQGYNFGEDYDIYWDDITTGPAGAVATDDCSNLLVTYQRSDDPELGLGDPFPVGTTTITWTATDDCGNTSTDTQLVMVDGSNLLDVAVELQGTVDSGPFDRCITFELTPTGGGSPVVVNETMTFTAGAASGFVEVPCGDYECITARDALHTLRSTDDDDFTIAGTNYVANFSGSDELVGGNFNADTYVDILDFGVLVGQFGLTLSVNTPCGTAGPHTDASGNGVVDTGDFTFVQINFLQFDEPTCSAPLPPAQGGSFAAATGMTRRDRPVTSISVEELNRLGLSDLVAADLNADGMLDTGDVAAFLGGARPDHLADIDRSGTVDVFDLLLVIDRMGQQAGLPYDIDGDGWVTATDLQFVMDRFGMTFGG